MFNTTPARRPRVLMVTPRALPFIGGIETHVYEVGRRLAASGVDVTLLTTDPTGELPESEQVEGVHVLRVRAYPARRDYYFAPGLWRVITTGQWDLMHLQGYHTLVAPLAMLAARRAHLPYVVTFHGGGSSSRLRNTLRRGQHLALRPLLAGAERLISPSRWEAEFFRGRLRLSGDRLSVIPNGARQALDPALIATGRTDGTLILSIGRLERYKGHHRLIEALPFVREAIPDARLRIAGDGPYEPELRALASRLGLEDCVEIRAARWGEPDGMEQLLMEARLVALLSDFESQGIAATDALALKRPVLVNEATALQELVERGWARGVSPEAGPTDVAAAIVRQLRDPLIPARVTIPTWDDCAAALLDVYESVLGRPLCESSCLPSSTRLLLAARSSRSGR